MKQYQFGEVVLVQFLFTGSKQYKRRPGLVLLDTGDKDVLVARITSKTAQTIFDLKIVEWKKAGLLLNSVVRLHKVYTIEKSLIERSLGRLEANDLNQVRKSIQQIWSSI